MAAAHVASVDLQVLDTVANYTKASTQNIDENVELSP